MKTNKIITSIMLGIYLISLASAMTIDSAMSSPAQVAPGEKVSLSLTLKNNLDEQATNVAVTLNLNGASTVVNGNLQQIFPAVPFAPYQSSNTASFEKVNDGDSKEVIFALISFANADSGTYNIPVSMSYTYNNTRQTDSGIVSITINAKPVMTLSSDSSGLIKGQNNELSIKIVNSGLGNAKFTGVQVNGATGMKIVGADNFYIGDINKDDFDSVKLNIFVNANAPSTLTIPVTLVYKDSTNKDFTQDSILSVKAYTKKEAVQMGLATQSNTGLIIGIIIAVIAAFIIYRIVKKRRNNKLKNQKNTGAPHPKGWGL